MFKPGNTVSYKNHNYNIVLDHAVMTIDEAEDDNSHFISSRQKINNNLEISFINNYKSATEQKKSIGFWQTILNNHAFDYSVDFKYQIKVDDDSGPFLISFDTSQGVSIQSEVGLVVDDIEDFDLIELDFSSFNNFQVIKTAQQVSEEKNKIFHKVALKHIIFYVLFFGLMFAYSQYQESIFNQKNNYLLSLKSEAVDLEYKVKKNKEDIVTQNVNIQQSHIKNLVRILSAPIVIQESEVNLVEALMMVTIALDDLEILKHIVKLNRNNTNFKISRNVVENIVNVSWDVKGAND